MDRKASRTEFIPFMTGGMPSRRAVPGRHVLSSEDMPTRGCAA